VKTTKHSNVELIFME